VVFFCINPTTHLLIGLKSQSPEYKIMPPYIE